MTSNNFDLHPQLAKDCFVIAESPLCQLLLLNDQRYPWCVLVPTVNDIREIYQLSTAQQQQLLAESSALSAAMQQVFSADKMNVAALGNMVPQLHLHHIARHTTDDAWPGPVWGAHPAIPYTGEEQDTAQRILAGLDALLPNNPFQATPF